VARVVNAILDTRGQFDQNGARHRTSITRDAMPSGSVSTSQRQSLGIRIDLHRERTTELKDGKPEKSLARNRDVEAVCG
jgi:hypothetical protein